MTAQDGTVRSATENGLNLFGGELGPIIGERCTDSSRYILSINLMDHAGSVWMTAFNEVAEQLMGVTANELHKVKVSFLLLESRAILTAQDEGDEAKFGKYFGDAAGKTFTFQMMAKQDSYNVSHLVA